MAGSKKFAAIVRSKEGSFVFRGAAEKKEILKYIEGLKGSGISERNIDILPVKSPKISFISGFMKTLGVISTACEAFYWGYNAWKFIKEEIRKRKEKKSNNESGVSNNSEVDS